MAEIRHERRTADNASWHQVKITVDGTAVGYAKLEYFSSPFPIYEVLTLRIDEGYRGRGYGRKILTAIENFLKEKKKPGLLIDIIAEDDGNALGAIGMYARSGWQHVPNEPHTLAYNLSPQTPIERLRGIHSRRGSHSYRARIPAEP